MKHPVSIIIPTRNRSGILARSLAALPAGASGAPVHEVIVVDDCSKDDTERTVDQFRSISAWQINYLRHDRSAGANAARNTALRIAGGEIVAFIDDDVLVTEGWLGKLVVGLSKECPVMSGPVHLTLQGPIVGKHREEIAGYLSEILSAPLGWRGEIVPAACNMAAYRWVFERAEFDDSLHPPVEENDWLERAGVKAGFAPDAGVLHQKSPEEATPPRLLAGAWRRGSEAGRWVRERLELPASERRNLAKRSLQTSARAFGHAIGDCCWGGAIIGTGELSRALALAGLINRGHRVARSWR